MSEGQQGDSPVIPAKYRNPVMHDTSASNYVGTWQVTDEALAHYGVAREYFGTTCIQLPQNASFRVKDYHYVLPDGSIGMRFLPVNDTGPIVDQHGNFQEGSALVDALIREEQGLAEDDPIYAIIWYCHPELNDDTLGGFAKTEKVEMGVTHLGAYMGRGRTSNSPPLYHDRVWGVKGDPGKDYGYPANVVTVALDGVDQGMLNRNLHIVDNFLNYGVRFPKDYKNNKFRAVDVNTALMFYKDWIMEAPYLKQDVTWFTYCAAHKTIVLTVALNLPHNKDSFMEVYGAEEGAAFYEALCDNYYQLTGWPFEASEEYGTGSHETHFEPLWKKQGLTPAQIRPFTLDEYDAYDAARRAGTLEHFKGFKPVPTNQATAWAPQMSSDVILDFVQSYADFVDAGGVTAAVTTLGLTKVASERAKFPVLEAMMLAIPVAQHIMLADAKVHAASAPTDSYADSPYYKAVFAAISAAIGSASQADPAAVEASSAAQALTSGSWLDKLKKLAESWEPDVVAWFTLLLVRQQWSEIMAGGCLSVADAYVAMMDAIQGELEKARDAIVTNAEGIQYNAPPAIAHMVGIGMFPCGEHLDIRTSFTVMNHTELEPTGA